MKLGLAKLSPDLIGYRTRVDANNNVPIVDPVQHIRPVSGPCLQYLTSVCLALSAGVSLRVNMFGYFILEPYLAWPINRTDVSKPVFGLRLYTGLVIIKLM
jgi:hypothetical protein